MGFHVFLSIPLQLLVLTRHCSDKEYSLFLLIRSINALFPTMEFKHTFLQVPRLIFPRMTYEIHCRFGVVPKSTIILSFSESTTITFSIILGLTWTLQFLFVCVVQLISIFLSYGFMHRILILIPDRYITKAFIKQFK